MLKEIFPIIQNEAPFFKKWYHSTEGSLFLWEKDSIIEYFQFCFSDFQGEKCFSWKKGGIITIYSLTNKLSHQGTIGLEGEGIMVNLEEYDINYVKERFTYLSMEIPLEIRKFILAILTKLNENTKKKDNSLFTDSNI